LTYRSTWGEDRVYVRDDAGRLHHMPIGWTSAAPPDPFKVVAAGRCRFRPEDLLRLAELIETSRLGSVCKENNADLVRSISPSPARDPLSDSDPHGAHVSVITE